MKKLRINVVGRGVFGSFLLKEFSKFAQQDSRAHHVFLAVPFADYPKAACDHRGKHLINVCSVQSTTTAICRKYSGPVTSIHPMYGPRSPKEGRTAVLTYCNNRWLSEIIQLFQKTGVDVHTLDGYLSADQGPFEHDKIMAKTHLPLVLFGQMAREIVERTPDVPDWMLPTSFKRLKALVEQIRDMSPGTLASIKANPYW